MLTIGLLISLNTFAYDFIKDGIKYNILTNSTCEVAAGEYSILGGGHEYDRDTFIIPSQVEYNDKIFTVTAIGKGAFEHANINRIIIPEAITKIGNFAFESSKIQHINLPSGITQIPRWCFRSCENLSYVEIPNGVTEIEWLAFGNCKNLRSIDIPNSVTKIIDGAFQDCESLKTVTIGKSLKIIYDSAFLGCNNIENITIYSQKPPGIVCYINDDVFQGITYLSATLYVPKGALGAYRNAEYWSKFENIKELENSGIENINAHSINVTTTNGGIVVSGLDGKVTIDVYNTNGQLVYKGTETTISVPTKGIYIVRVAGQTFKVAL